MRMKMKMKMNYNYADDDAPAVCNPCRIASAYPVQVCNRVTSKQICITSKILNKYNLPINNITLYTQHIFIYIYLSIAS